VIRADLLDELVWTHISEALKHPESILETLRREQSEHGERANVLRERKAILTREIVKRERDRSMLLDLYLDEANPMPKAVLEEKTNAFNTDIARYSAEIADIERQENEVAVADASLERMYQYCQQTSEGLDTFNFEERRNTLETLNVSCVLQRGETPDQDVLIVRGYLPEIQINCVDVVLTTSSNSVGDRSKRPGPSRPFPMHRFCWRKTRRMGQSPRPA
jgi:hypothetical protein